LRLRRANGSFHVIKHRPRNSARLLSQFGYAIHRTSLLDGAPPDVDAQAVALFRSVRPFTMTSIERVYALRGAWVSFLY
jgi:hypothetical protein